MPSRLTRQVFLRLLANEPIVHRGCLRRQTYSSLARSTVPATRTRRQNGTPSTTLEQRRSFFNFGMFRKAKREVKEADMDPGIEKMMDLEKLQRLKARLPPVEDVRKALSSFLAAKAKQARAMEDVQAKLCLLSMRYCFDAFRDATDEAKVGRGALSKVMVSDAISILRRPPKQVTPDHVEIAKVILEQISPHGTARYRNAMDAYICLLSRSGSHKAALDILLEKEDSLYSTITIGKPNETRHDITEDNGGPEYSVEEVEEAETLAEGGKLKSTAVVLWSHLLKGFIVHGSPTDVQEILEMIKQRGIENERPIAANMLDYALEQDDALAVKHWWPVYWSSSLTKPNSKAKATGGMVNMLLQWCRSDEHLDLGHSIVREIMQVNPPKPVWDAILVWAAGTGKGVDEIRRMLDVMERSNQVIEDRSEWRVPDIATINGLVKFAIVKSDPYMAERFIALGRDRGIEADAKTYVLQIEYRLSVDDIDGALTAYKSLQELDLSTDEDVPTVNKLITALCSSKRHDFETAMNVAADLTDRRARFAPETVSTLSLLHLDRDELHDVIDLLNTHAFHYSSSERSVVRLAIVAYCLSPNAPISRAWDAYTIIRNVFDELPREPRTELMTNFFQRDRPDMAVHVFNHMRQHSRLDTLPIIDTYVTAFMGCAKRDDLESLEVVHNQLKLDYNININTHLRNALIIGYTSCGRPRKALGFWDEIVASREGPGYNSIHIALRACERSPFGDLKAKEIWEKLRKMNVELDSSMWASYLAALGGNGDVELAVGALEEAERKGELEVDAFVLGSLFAGTPGHVKQGEVEQWAKARYPRFWAELEKVGVQEAEDGERMFMIDRSVTP